MVKCAGMVERHLEGILAHWEGHITNAFMEGLNSVFSAVKRKARGFRSVDNLVVMLYFHAANLSIPTFHSK
jgi:transposase